MFHCRSGHSRTFSTKARAQAKTFDQEISLGSDVKESGSINRMNPGAQSYSTEKMAFFTVDSLVPWWCLVLGRHLINMCYSNQPRDLTIELLSIYLTPGLNVVSVKMNSGFTLFRFLSFFLFFFFFLILHYMPLSFGENWKQRWVRNEQGWWKEHPPGTSLLMRPSCSEALLSSISQRVNPWQIATSACSFQAGSVHFLYL